MLKKHQRLNIINHVLFSSQENNSSTQQWIRRILGYCILNIYKNLLWWGSVQEIRLCPFSNSVLYRYISSFTGFPRLHVVRSWWQERFCPLRASLETPISTEKLIYFLIKNRNSLRNQDSSPESAKNGNPVNSIGAMKILLVELDGMSTVLYPDK